MPGFPHRATNSPQDSCGFKHLIGRTGFKHMMIFCEIVLVLELKYGFKKGFEHIVILFFFDYITSFEVGYLGLCFGKVVKFSVFNISK